MRSLPQTLQISGMCDRHFLLVLIWLLIGIGLRFTNLASKSPWTDEFSTIVFSLGNSFEQIPLDQAIGIDVLLQPLQPEFNKTGIGDVIYNLFHESNHPPVYFILAHWWMKLFPIPGKLTVLWIARSLSALFGAASIPAMYGLGWLAFRSRLVGQIAAAIAAVSPYGIYLAQEARHYTLGILLVIASLSCLVMAIRSIYQHNSLSIWVGLSWILVNSLGVAVHYFFIFTILAEGIVLLIFCWRFPLKSIIFLRLIAVATGTLVGCLIWIPIWKNSYDLQLVQWIYLNERSGIGWISPFFQAFAAWITMLFLLPIESPNLVIAIISIVVMAIFFLWVLPILNKGLKSQYQKFRNRLYIEVFAGIGFISVGIFFFFTYILGIDLTRGARYNFVYFPAIIILISASLAEIWSQEKPNLLPIAKSKQNPYLSWIIHPEKTCDRNYLAHGFS